MTERDFESGYHRSRRSLSSPDCEVRPCSRHHRVHQPKGAPHDKILAEAKSKGWTAEQIARKAGVSKWTVYGWNKRSPAKGKRTNVKRGRPGRPTRQAGTLGEMLRPLIAEMVRAELARLAGR